MYNPVKIGRIGCAWLLDDAELFMDDFGEWGEAIRSAGRIGNLGPGLKCRCGRVHRGLLVAGSCRMPSTCRNNHKTLMTYNRACALQPLFACVHVACALAVVIWSRRN